MRPGGGRVFPARNPKRAWAALRRGGKAAYRQDKQKDRPKSVSAHNWAPDLLSFRLSRGPKRSPSLNFARVRRAGVVEGLFCYLPMRFVSIGQPHVHHERISVVCAFDPNRARLWFQSHRDKSHFPNYPAVAKNLRLEGTSAFRSRRSRGLNRRQADSFRAASQSLPPASPSGLDFSAGRHLGQPYGPKTHQRRSWSHGGASGYAVLAYGACRF